MFGGMIMDSLFIVMPAYNEEANIEGVVRQWYPILNGKGEKSRLVIADSGSVDATHEILMKLQGEFPKLEILTDSEKQHGPKVIALYDYAIKKGADYIFQTDSDGQTNPDEFANFWNLRLEYDGIFGNRTVRGDGAQRAFVEKVVCFLLKLYFGVKVPDANAPFRLMKASVVQKYLGKLPYDYNLPNIMMTTYFAHYNEKMTFKEISFKPRTAGVNSVNIPRIVKIGWKALGDFRTLKKGMNN
jgi:glycosyltransferase involved in cell wall biosynthesis